MGYYLTEADERAGEKTRITRARRGVRHPDAWNILAEIGTSGSLVRSYLWGLDLSGSMQGAGGVGGLVAASLGANGTHFAAYDGNGNVAVLVDASSGSVFGQYEYGPFGETLRASGAASGLNPFRFSTKYADAETGLLDYGYRYYNPGTGRWLSRDPDDEEGGLNLHAFVENDAVSSTDPLGLWKWKEGKRDGSERATVVAEKCRDPYDDLATMIGLDPSEVKKWLKTWKPNDQVKKDEEFTVPNTVYVNRYLPAYNPQNWLFILYASDEGDKLISQGFHVVRSSSITSEAETAQFKSPDIFGLIHVAHGDPDYHGELQEADLYMLDPTMLRLDHKLGGLKIVQCWGDEKPWRGLVSPNGVYWAGHEKVHVNQLPSRGF